MITQFISDNSWNCIASLFPRKHRGRPPEHDRRHVFEAILYVLKSGCQWRLLPDCYPPWQTVYGYFRAWSLKGIIDSMLARLRKKCRKAEGKDHRSRIAIIDSQSVKTTRCAATKGFDGKKPVATDGERWQISFLYPPTIFPTAFTNKTLAHLLYIHYGTKEF